MIIKFNIEQMYKCIDRELFEEEVYHNKGKKFFLKSIEFENIDNTREFRDIFVSDDNITLIKLFNDGIRTAKVFFNGRNTEVIDDRQHNDIFLDVKYLKEQDMVVIANKHYDLTSQFSTFQILYINKEIDINPEKDLDKLKEIIHKKTNKIIKSVVLAVDKVYCVKDSALFVENENFPFIERHIISTSQYELYISGDICVICMIKNKMI